MKHSLFSNDIVSERPFKESTSKMLTKEEFTCLARKYMDMVFRVAMNYLKKSPERIVECGKNAWLFGKKNDINHFGKKLRKLFES